MRKTLSRSRKSHDQVHRTLARLERRAADDDLFAITKLAEIYSSGTLVKKNARKVEYFLKRGAALKDPYLTWCLADATYHGDGLVKSEVEGLRLYAKAAKYGVADAWTAIGVHNHELGTNESKRSAIQYYKKAAKFDEPHALFNLGLIYSSGDIVTKNTKKAFTYFYRAAKLKHSGAQYKVGWHLLHGIGVGVDYRAAKRWLLKASKQGSKPAANLLIKLTNHK